MSKYSRFTRRQFIAGSVAAGAMLTVPWYLDTWTAFAFYQSQGLRMFHQPLRGVGPGGIPVAAPDAFPAPVTGVTHYSFNISQFTDQLHPQLDPTKLWGYNPVVPLGGGTQPQKHLGGFWSYNGESPFSSRSRIHYHQSISCQSIPVPTFLKQRSTRMPLQPMYMVD